MPENDGSSAKPPQQISEMFQKFALAFKTKTFEFFADEYSAVAAEDSDGFSLLDSAEEIITDQKVVVIKPDSAAHDFSPKTTPSPTTQPEVPKPPPLAAEIQVEKLEIEEKLPSPVKNVTQIRAISSEMTHALISSMFATVYAQRITQYMLDHVEYFSPKYQILKIWIETVR